MNARVHDCHPAYPSLRPYSRKAAKLAKISIRTSKDVPFTGRTQLLSFSERFESAATSVDFSPKCHPKCHPKCNFCTLKIGRHVDQVVNEGLPMLCFRDFSRESCSDFVIPNPRDSLVSKLETTASFCSRRAQKNVVQHAGKHHPSALFGETYYNERNNLFELRPRNY